MSRSLTLSLATLLLYVAVEPVLSQGHRGGRSYILDSCESKENITATLPSGCEVEASFPFLRKGRHCPCFRIHCNMGLGTETRSIITRSVGSDRTDMDLEDDPVVENIVPKIPIGSDNDFIIKAKEQAASLKRKLSDLNDPRFDKQWNLLSDGSAYGTSVSYDNNFGPLLAANLRGNGIKVVLLDDGLEIDHPDLAENVDKSLVKNLVSPVNIAGVHGTACASLIGAAASNNRCILGGAPKVSLGIVKFVGYRITSSEEAEALNAFFDQTDIYSNSWGPTDGGNMISGPSSLTQAALEHGVKNGRNGKGAIYVWAAGNGGKNSDSCGADLYVNNPHVVPVQALDESGSPAYYAETCSAIMISTYIGNHNSPSDTLTGYGSCQAAFLGTSAATPILSACVAIMLEVNPRLLWRDVNGIIAWSGTAPRGNDQIWQVTASGLIRSETAGFGALDCTRAANLAKQWSNMGVYCQAARYYGSYIKGWQNGFNKQVLVDSYTKVREFFNKWSRDGQSIYKGYSVKMEMDMRSSPIRGSVKFGKQHGKVEGSPCSMERVERITVFMQLSHLCRGSLSFWLRSPSGTMSILLTGREKDAHSGQFELSFNSNTFYGEPVQGMWTLYVSDEGVCKSNRYVHYNSPSVRGQVVFAQMVVHGTDEAGSAYSKNSRLINPIMTSVGKSAKQAGRGHVLTKEEWAQVQRESKWSRLAEEAPQ